jgi:hypothetical protein
MKTADARQGPRLAWFGLALLTKHSRRILPTRRSQKAFAWGAWNGVFKMLKPIVSFAKTSAEIQDGAVLGGVGRRLPVR